jgi:phage terminase large subunit-like protein
MKKKRLVKPELKPRRTEAERVIRWIERYCRIPEGRDVGREVRLRDFQKQWLRQIYDNPAGTRRAIISVGRKNAKTTLSAFILLLHLCGIKAQYNSQLFSAAQSRDQAALLFNLAAKVVRMSPELSDKVVVRETVKQLACPERGTLYRALSAEVSTAFGLSPSLVIHDELGQVRGPRSELYEALETATGAQENPLSIIISTQAPTDADLLSTLIDDALAGNDPRTVCMLHAASLEDDPFIEPTIKAANPAFGDFLNPREVMAMAADAKRMPSREAEFRNLILNQRVEASNPFVTRSVWQACGAPVKDIHGIKVYAGLDLASTSDLTAFVMIGNIGGVWQVHPTFWLPEHGLAARSRTDRVPYDQWEKENFLKTTPGKVVSYEYVAIWLRKQFNEYNIVKLGFDRWNMKHLQPWLTKAGFGDMEIKDKFVEFGQGTASMSPALRDLEELILDNRIAHGHHKLLSMCAAQAVVEGKDDANRRLSKNKSTGRIDGMVALAMAVGVATAKVVDISTMIG